jgi:NAD(P)H-nitrite reductase large subunit
MKVVTVGTGMAAAEFVERLRLEGFDGEIVMCGDEHYPPYSPCVIPFFLAGEPVDTVFWKGKDFYEKYRVNARLGDPVVEVNVERRFITTASGRRESYDRLFYAAGSRNRYTNPQWLETAGVFGFKTLTDMEAIDCYVREHKVKKAVVFGGGFIGVDAALALRSRGIDVSIIHRNTRLLSQMTDEEGGEFATCRLAEKTGMDIRLRTTVNDICSENGMLSSVRLSDREEINTPLLIVAVGVAPNSGPLTGNDSGISVNGQMLVDDGVYTAGDVAVTSHAVNGVQGIYANYPNAMQQSRVAARHLVHGDGAYSGSLNCTVLRKHINFPVISVGSFTGESVTWQRGDVWRRVYLHEGMINGYIIIGDSRVSGYLYQLYISRKRVDGTIKSVISGAGREGQFREFLGMSASCKESGRGFAGVS